MPIEHANCPSFTESERGEVGRGGGRLFLLECHVCDDRCVKMSWVLVLLDSETSDETTPTCPLTARSRLRLPPLHKALRQRCSDGLLPAGTRVDGGEHGNDADH